MHNYRVFIVACILALLSGLSISVHAQQTQQDIPRLISYQGMLSTTAGAPLPDGEYGLTVTLYGDASGASPIWSDLYRAKVIGGVFSIYLGGGSKPLPATAEMNRPLWLGVRVGDQAEMRPLTQLSAAPYALALPNGAVTSEKLATGAVTAEKLGTDYVSEIRVNGQKVTGAGTGLNIRGGEGLAVTFDDKTQSLVVGKNSPAAQDDPRAPHALGTDNAWRQAGDLVDPSHNHVFITDTLNNWIGTTISSSNTYKTFDVKVNSRRVVRYQPDPALSTGTPSIVGGYENNFIASAATGSVIAGGGLSGGTNLITGTSDFAAIGGGASNSIGRSGRATIGGGSDILIDSSHHAVVAGGDNNKIRFLGNYSTISGGNSNTIDRRSDVSVIAGGGFNTMDTMTVSGVISGGENNEIHGGRTVGGIDSIGRASVIAGGLGNNIGQVSSYSTISGGNFNRIGDNADFSNIGGGVLNILDNLVDYSSIGGGRHNVVKTDGHFVVIAGGDSNTADGYHIAIGGGRFNQATTQFATIGGGDSNRISVGKWATIGGGRNNVATANHASILGGVDNQANGVETSVVGGRANKADGVGAFIGGGQGNYSGATYSVIGGGNLNSTDVQSQNNVIGGGYNNAIKDHSDFNMIGGGVDHIIYAGSGYNVIAGGGGHRILANVGLASIVGGEHNIAQSWGQTVMGVYNVQKGNVPFHYGGLFPQNFQDPILIVGNGDTNHNKRSNAFEVSYSGHTTVFHDNGPVDGAIKGATYTDNVVYAWGNVPMNGIPVTCGFGVKNVIKRGLGWYEIEVNTVLPFPNNTTRVNLSCASITATINSGTGPGSQHGQCIFITASQIDPLTNKFDIYTTAQSFNGFGLECKPVDAPFNFKVTGRMAGQ